MGCSSCGGGAARTVTRMGGVTRQKTPRTYVWTWRSTSGEKKQFSSEKEARDWNKDHPGTLVIEPG